MESHFTRWKTLDREDRGGYPAPQALSLSLIALSDYQIMYSG